MFKDKTILITGGTGSFGHAVVRRFLHADTLACCIMADIRAELKDGLARRFSPNNSVECKSKFYFKFTVNITNKSTQKVEYLINFREYEQNI